MAAEATGRRLLGEVEEVGLDEVSLVCADGGEVFSLRFPDCATCDCFLKIEPPRDSTTRRT